MWKKHL